jgi:hypothetical protein
MAVSLFLDRATIATAMASAGMISAVERRIRRLLKDRGAAKTVRGRD